MFMIIINEHTQCDCVIFNINHLKHRTSTLRDIRDLILYIYVIIHCCQVPLTEREKHSWEATKHAKGFIKKYESAGSVTEAYFDCWTKYKQIVTFCIFRIIAELWSVVQRTPALKLGPSALLLATTIWREEFLSVDNVGLRGLSSIDDWLSHSRVLNMWYFATCLDVWSSG